MGKSSGGGGVSLLGVLQVVFIVLKVVDVIDWSWWVVLIPAFVSLGVLFLVVFIALVVAAFSERTW